MLLVTGCAGFIGFHLSKRLLDQGLDVIGVDNFDPYYDTNLKSDRLDELRKNKKFVFIKKACGDLLKKDLEDVDIIFHQGARAGVRSSIENPIIYNELNVNSTVKLLKLAVDSKVKKIIFASTSSVYGDVDKFPITEEHPTNPKNPYAVSKLAAEKYLSAFYNCYGLQYISLRYFTVYGPWGRPDMFMAKVLDSCFGGKPFLRFVKKGKLIDFKRDFSYIDDIVDANILAMKSKIENDIFNISSEKDISIEYIIKLIAKETGKEPKSIESAPNPADVLRTWADISKAKKILGYKPKTSIEQGVKNLVKWYIDYHKLN